MSLHREVTVERGDGILLRVRVTFGDGGSYWQPPEGDEADLVSAWRNGKRLDPGQVEALRIDWDAVLEEAIERARREYEDNIADSTEDEDR